MLIWYRVGDLAVWPNHTHMMYMYMRVHAIQKADPLPNISLLYY